MLGTTHMLKDTRVHCLQLNHKQGEKSQSQMSGNEELPAKLYLLMGNFFYY